MKENLNLVKIIRNSSGNLSSGIIHNKKEDEMSRETFTVLTIDEGNKAKYNIVVHNDSF